MLNHECVVEQDRRHKLVAMIEMEFSADLMEYLAGEKKNNYYIFKRIKLNLN